MNYTVIFKQLIEYQDLNEDGVFQYNESLPGMPLLTLTSVKWIFSGFTTEQDGDVITALHFNFTSEEIMVGLYAGLDITISMHLYLEDQVIEGYELEGGAEVKFDIYLSDWPWQEEDSNLAIRFDIVLAEGNQIRNQHNQPIDATINTTNNERKLENDENKVKQMLTFENQEHSAFFGYANQSKIRNTFETQYRYGSVNASYSTSGENVLKLFICFEHFDELIYDPSLGTLDEDFSGVSLSWITALIAPIILAALIRVSKQNKK
jgi:hypothetical protein